MKNRHKINSRGMHSQFLPKTIIKCIASIIKTIPAGREIEMEFKILNFVLNKVKSLQITLQYRLSLSFFENSTPFLHIPLTIVYF